MKNNNLEHSQKVITLAVVSLVLSVSIVLNFFFIYLLQNKHKMESSSAFDLSLVEYINKYRIENGKPALAENVALDEAAQERADEIAQCGERCHNHTRPDGRIYSTAIDSMRPFKSASENLVEYATSNYEAVGAWKTSERHNQNMLGTLPDQVGQWQYIGTGMAHGEKCKCNVYVSFFANGK